MADDINDFLICIAGKAANGKTTALKGLENQEGVLYLNCEAGKRLTFKNSFVTHKITDPYEVHGIFKQLQQTDKYHTVVIDSITYLMEMYETKYVVNADDTRKAWQNYQQYFKELIQELVPKANRVTILTAHTKSDLTEDAVRETFIPVKGALKNNGIESYFSLVLGAKRLNLSALQGYESDLLNITDREKRLGFKHVLQTDITADTVHERLRSPIDLFSDEEAFVDGNIQVVINRLKEYYK